MAIDLDSILKALQLQRGISRESLISIIENAVQSAARKSLNTSGDVRVVVDPETLEIKAWQRRLVDDNVRGTAYIPLAEARRVKPDAQPGDTVETPFDPRILGRIAALAAKQALAQGMHDSERDILQQRYAASVGRIVRARVVRVAHKDTICTIVGTGGEAILKGRDRMKTDRFQMDDEFRAVIRHVGMEQDQRRMDGDEPGDGTERLVNRRRVRMIDEPSNNPIVKLSRTDDTFVRALFAEQSTEIKDGIIEIVALARQPGVRTKLAVRTRDPKVDPVGACVGVRGSRIRPVIQELNGEKIDIIEWEEDIGKFAVAALAPAAVRKVAVDAASRHIIAYVENGGLTPAIGRNGINTRLAADLLSAAGPKWTISLRELSDEGETDEEQRVRAARFQAQLEERIATLAEALEIEPDAARIVVGRGFLTPDGIMALTPADFAVAMSEEREDGNGAAVQGLDPASAEALWSKAEAYFVRAAGGGEASN
ncbi:MAG: hypothetical protein IJS46_01210 [Kiritimatiellae bacterium]|nr:hypothetical protein [Kiritimatiellia bacterium]